jgi:hypothetical protein
MQLTILPSTTMVHELNDDRGIMSFRGFASAAVLCPRNGAAGAVRSQSIVQIRVSWTGLIAAEIAGLKQIKGLEVMN